MDLCMAANILGVNIRRNLAPHLLTAFLIALFTPLICGINSLQGASAAQPLEKILCLCGPVLLTPIFWPEHDADIRDVIRSKKTDYLAVCAVRVCCCVIALAAIYGGFVFMMRVCESGAGIRHFAGGFASALFLGALGFGAAGCFDSPVAGYMAAMIYYILNYMLKMKLGRWFLFSMSIGGGFEGKYWLLGGSAALLLAGFAGAKHRMER